MIYCVTFAENNYLKADVFASPKYRKVMKSEPNRLIPQTLAANLELIIVVKLKNVGCIYRSNCSNDNII